MGPCPLSRALVWTPSFSSPLWPSPSLHVSLHPREVRGKVRLRRFGDETGTVHLMKGKGGVAWDTGPERTEWGTVGKEKRGPGPTTQVEKVPWRWPEAQLGPCAEFQSLHTLEGCCWRSPPSPPSSAHMGPPGTSASLLEGGAGSTSAEEWGWGVWAEEQPGP